MVPGPSVSGPCKRIVPGAVYLQRGDGPILLAHWLVAVLAVKGSSWATFRRWARYSARALSADFQVRRVFAASPSSRVESPSDVATLGANAVLGAKWRSSATVAASTSFAWCGLSAIIKPALARRHGRRSPKSEMTGTGQAGRASYALCTSQGGRECTLSQPPQAAALSGDGAQALYLASARVQCGALP